MEINFILREEVNEQMFCHNPEICKECKGAACCGNSACAYSPEDFYVFRHSFSESDCLKYLKHKIRQGYMTITHLRVKNSSLGAINLETLKVESERLKNYEGILYLRGRNVGRPIVEVVDQKNAPCMLWNPQTGCKLSYQRRPKGGRLLIPRRNFFGVFDCGAAYSEFSAAMDWAKYQNILYKLYEYALTL